LFLEENVVKRKQFPTITIPILIKGIRLLAVAVLLAGFVFAVKPAPLTYAATLTVTTTADELASPGTGCSLREAITNANNNASTYPECYMVGAYGSDTITFAPTVAGIPIVLTGGSGEDANATGDLDILASGGNLTINGTMTAIIDGGGIDRVLHVCPGGACSITVILDHMIIQNGHAGASDGGGIYNNATLIVRNGSAIGRSSGGNTTTGNGGGILNYIGATIAVDASTVSANTADYGGGIYNMGTLTVTNGSTVGGAGAGNTATSGGGGIFNNAFATTVDASTIGANTADDGGGIYNTGTLTVTNGSTIGGIGVANTASDKGGGIYNAIIGATTVNGSIVSANTATAGGGIYNEHIGTLTVQNGSIIGGAGAGNIATAAGGIYSNGGATTVDGSTVSANTADFGGGIINITTLIVQNGSTIGGAGAGNTAVYDGGGILNTDDGSTTVDGSTVSANTANNCGGIFNSATLTVTNGSTIGGTGAGNTAHSDGGGICQSSIDGTTTVTGSRILYNTASGAGGGVENSRNIVGAISVTGSCIVGNSANSFHNNVIQQQTATGNWWGAATGPNTPDADTTGGNVDTSGFLTSPILGCPSGGSGASGSEEVYLPILVRND
jgi:CSLREA domain-containing protein